MIVIMCLQFQMNLQVIILKDASRKQKVIVGMDALTMIQQILAKMNQLIPIHLLDSIISQLLLIFMDFKSDPTLMETLIHGFQNRLEALVIYHMNNNISMQLQMLKDKSFIDFMILLLNLLR